MNAGNHQSYDVAIVGGGLAGLTAATLLGRAGKSVVVYERSDSLGGRAATRNIDGFHFNLGPHALYRGGHAMRVLEEMGITIGEAPVGTSGATAVRDNVVHPLPGTLMSMLRSRLLSFSGRMEVMRFFATVTRIDTRAQDHVPLEQYLNEHIRTHDARMFIETLIRVATYSNSPRELSAGGALDQFRMVLQGGVTYLNGGWQTLVARLRDAALAAGAIVHTGTTIRSLDTIPANVFVLALPPKSVASILGKAAGSRLLQAIANLKPVQAACLDLGLRTLPEPTRTFSAGVDQPFYFSVHSRWAHLAPSGKVLIHVAKYLPWGEETNPANDREELAGFLDVVQPGWWKHVEHERFMPRLNVTQTLVRAADGGLAGRPAVDDPAAENVYIAGDWVGNEGMLADAAFASASRAARLIVGARQPILEAQAV
jgi:phytoene dehydrogenase-like protein